MSFFPLWDKKGKRGKGRKKNRHWEEEEPTYIRSVVTNTIVLSDSEIMTPFPREAMDVIEHMEREGYERHPELWKEGRPRPPWSDNATEYKIDGEPQSKQRRIYH